MRMDKHGNDGNFVLLLALREPPYRLKESGWASFTPRIDIHFKSRDDQKPFSVFYDLELLRPTTQKYFHIISSASSDFRHRLLENGALVLNSDGKCCVENTLKHTTKDKKLGQTF